VLRRIAIAFGMIWQADRSEMGVTLDQLRIFVAVAERQHVTYAAEALNLAQSAASHAIASLEIPPRLAQF
jgi:hypothetical protein